MRWDEMREDEWYERTRRDHPSRPQSIHGCHGRTPCSSAAGGGDFGREKTSSLSVRRGSKADDQRCAELSGRCASMIGIRLTQIGVSSTSVISRGQRQSLLIVVVVALYTRPQPPPPPLFVFSYLTDKLNTIIYSSLFTIYGRKK